MVVRHVREIYNRARVVALTSSSFREQSPRDIVPSPSFAHLLGAIREYCPVKNDGGSFNCDHERKRVENLRISSRCRDLRKGRKRFVSLGMRARY